jgi:hypothetical protein
MVSKIKLETDLKQALRNKDDLGKNVLRMVLSAMKLVEIEKGIALDEAGIISVLHKEIKSRREAIADAEKIGREDIITETKAEISLLESYLPSALTPVELEELARQSIRDAGATSLREMGQVMKILMPRLQGRVTGDQASQIVRQMLADSQK